MGKRQMQRGLVVVFMLICSICLCCCGMTEKDIKPDDRIINMSDLQEEISPDGEITKVVNADEIPINTDVHRIQVTNGTTGDVLELSREIQPEAFWEIMQKYERLDVKESENQTPWTGYSYRLQLLDEEGKELYSVYPKGQYIEINNIRYEDFEKTTTVELMLAVDACWKEDLPMGDLVETERQELDVIEGFSMDVTYATCRGVSLQFTNQTDKNIMWVQNL